MRNCIRLRMFWLLICILFSTVKGICINNGTCLSLTQAIRSIFFKTVCYQHLGCFSSGPPFYHPVHRPITMPPQSPEVIMARFMLYTRRNRNRPDYLSVGDTRALKKSFFDPRSMTRILIHGYLDGVGITRWTLTLKDILLEKSDNNVILVDWSGGSVTTYTQAVANTRVVGALTANFVRFLNAKTNTIPERFHFIGHSLGAHISGYVGQRVPNIGRITGLDPAGPLFNYLPPEVVLDPTDALFVDNIHTDLGQAIIDGFGIAEDDGHLDFWPWNAELPKVICAGRLLTALIEGPIFELSMVITSCRHYMCAEYFNYSFNQSDCLFVGVKCKSWDAFASGQCNCGKRGKRCQIMGYFAEPPGRNERKREDYRYYMKTAFARPYCLHQYQIKLHIHSSHVTKEEEYAAEITVTGYHSEMKSEVKFFINPRQPQQKIKFLLTNEKALEKVHSVTIRYTENMNCGFERDTTDKWSIQNGTHFDIEKIEITYLYPLAKSHTRSFLCKDPERIEEKCGNKFHFFRETCDV